MAGAQIAGAQPHPFRFPLPFGGLPREPPSVESLLLSLKSSNGWERLYAARALDGARDPRVVPSLIKALQDPLPDVRMAAASSLVRIGDPRAMKPITGLFEGSGSISPRERWWYAELLAGFRTPSVPPRLPHEPPPADAFPRITKPEVVEHLLVSLRSADPLTRGSAARCLRLADDPRIVEDLIGLLSDADRRVRIEAAESLGLKGDARAVQPLMDRMKDVDPFEKAEASAIAEALGRIGAPGSARAITGFLGRGDRRMRVHCARILGGIGDREAIDWLVSALADDESGVPREATRALGEIGEDRAAAPLLALFSSRSVSRGTRDEAARALEKIGGPRVVTGLVELLEDYEDFMQARAARALGAIGTPKATEPLHALILNDRAERETRDAAARSLGKIPGDRAEALLLEDLRSEKPHIRRYAVLGLGSRTDENAIGSVVAALGDDDPRVRSAAIECIRRAEGLAVAALERALMKESSVPREWVVRALAGICAPRSKELLERIASDPSESAEIRDIATKAVDRLGTCTQ